MCISVTIKDIGVQNDVYPEKGMEIVLVCSVSNFDLDIYVYKTAQPVTGMDASICRCNVNKCTSYSPRYTFRGNNSGIYISFPPLNRSLDQAYWTCANDAGQNKSVNLLVYSK